MVTKSGRAPSGQAGRATPQAAARLDHPATIPCADDGEYRMNPQFRRFLEAVGPVDRAMIAWDIAQEAFAPVTPEAEFEVWQNDAMVAGCSGPRDRALAEAVHYAVVYQADGNPCLIQEVTRREISPDDAHAALAKAAFE